MFSYNIKKQSAQALNRERKNVGRTAYADDIKKILKSCSTENVLIPFIKDLLESSENWKDEISVWSDVAQYIIKMAYKFDQLKDIVFIPKSKQITNQERDEIIGNKKIVYIPDKLYEKIKKTKEIPTIEKLYDEYKKSFIYKYIDVNNLTQSERSVFDLKEKIFDFLKSKNFKICKNIKISENICIDKHGQKTYGLCKYEDNVIIIKREVLADPVKFCEVITHELAHYQHGYSDSSRDFENDLSEILGHSIYCVIVK